MASLNLPHWVKANRPSRGGLIQNSNGQERLRTTRSTLEAKMKNTEGKVQDLQWPSIYIHERNSPVCGFRLATSRGGRLALLTETSAQKRTGADFKVRFC